MMAETRALTFLAVLTLCFGSVKLSAQSPSLAREEIPLQAALQNLRGNNDLFLRLQGLESLDGKAVHSITGDLYWSANPTGNVPCTKVELLEYKDGSLQHRIVGDGTVAWEYNLATYELGTGRYGRFDGTVAPNYGRDLLAFLQSQSFGRNGAFNVRLIRQIYGDAQATYQSWLPGTIPFDKQLGGGVHDLIYSVGNPVRRSITFHLTTDQLGDELSSIDYFDQSYQGRAVKTVQWTLTPYPVIPNGKNFEPYAANQIFGWRIKASQNLH